MNKFLKSASQRYCKLKESKDFIINPISEIDAEIIVEIGEIFKKQGLVDLAEILKSYKELKDEEIRDQLMQWNIDHPNGKNNKINNFIDKVIDEVIEEQKLPPFIQINNLRMKLCHLLGLELYERIDEEENYKWGIIINPTPEHTKQIPLYSNFKVEWFTEKDRNNVLYKLESVCQEQGIDFIDLMDTDGNE